LVTSQYFLFTRGEKSDHTLFFDHLPNTATYLPVAYLPATAGMAVGLAFNEPPWVCFLLARFFMLFTMLALGVAALAIAAYGEALILAIMLLPMSLFLAATVNQDGVLIGMACLAAAALTRPGGWSRLLGVTLLALILCSKQPYAPLLLVLLLPLEWPGLPRRARDMVLATIPMLIWSALIAAFVVVPFGQPPHHPGPLFEGDRSVIIDHTNPAANLHILLHKPLLFLTLPWHTAQFWFVESMREMVGVLGPLQLVLPDPYYHSWDICLVIAWLGLLVTPRARPVAVPTAIANFFLVAFAFLATYWLIEIAFYLSWTDTGADMISGFQGRYLLLFLPFAIFALPPLPLRIKIPPIVPALPAIAMGLIDVGYIPVKLVWNYYLH
jgi:hypothetical protein